ncbi:DUF1679 domain-containing protein [Mycolicibacterium moriokaense]|nr:DUF1679 domain-containing protein [Mycolicibacterium moriokaense]
MPPAAGPATHTPSSTTLTPSNGPPIANPSRDSHFTKSLISVTLAWLQAKTRRSAVAETRNRVAPFVGLAAHLGRGAQRVATDLVVGRARSLPRTIGDLDPRSLSQIMGTTVTSLSVISGDAGTSSRARLALSGDDVPDSVFVKMAAETAATRMMGELGRLAETETRFYRELSRELTGLPTSYGSAFDPVTGRFVLVLEDLAVDPCEFPDTLHPLTPDQAGLIIELLARLHATFWERPPAWAYTNSADSTSLLTGSLAKMSARRLAERTDIPIENGRFIIDNCRAVTQLVDQPPHTVTHGDAHPGNVYFRNGEAGLLDWQFVRRGHPGRELAYTLITGMTTDDRRTHQRELLDVYRSALAAAGGPELDGDELWDRYRMGAQYPFVAPLIVAGAGGMQAEGIAMEGLRRGVAALEDLDTVALLQKAL